MAVKSNAKSAKQAKPAADAAMVEATSGAVEPAVTPEQEGDAASVAASDTGQGQPDSPPEGSPDSEPPPEMSLHVNGKTITDSGVSEQPILFEGSSPYELEPVCTIGPEDMDSFADAVFEATASLIAGAGFFVRQDKELVSPFGKDILAVSFRQGKGFTAVVADGRKFILKDGEVNEA